MAVMTRKRRFFWFVARMSRRLEDRLKVRLEVISPDLCIRNLRSPISRLYPVEPNWRQLAHLCRVATSLITHCSGETAIPVTSITNDPFRAMHHGMGHLTEIPLRSKSVELSARIGLPFDMRLHAAAQQEIAAG